jgi:hypothetical protein
MFINLPFQIFVRHGVWIDPDIAQLFFYRLG